MQLTQPIHTCLCGSEKAFDRVLWRVLWGVLDEYKGWGPSFLGLLSPYMTGVRVWFTLPALNQIGLQCVLDSGRAGLCHRRGVQRLSQWEEAPGTRLWGSAGRNRSCLTFTFHTIASRTPCYSACFREIDKKCPISSADWLATNWVIVF